MTDIPSYIDWHVGDKIVCIDNAARFVELYPYRAKIGTPLKVGETYTIRAFKEDGEGSIGILLVEVKSTLPPLKHTGERPFDPSRFRKVQTRKTSIEIFNRILLNPSVKIREDA